MRHSKLRVQPRQVRHACAGKLRYSRQKEVAKPLFLAIAYPGHTGTGHQGPVSKALEVCYPRSRIEKMGFNLPR